jgi:Tfp pilus assembly protein PilW
MIVMTITLIVLGLIASVFSKSLSIRARESRRTDALTSAQAALSVMSREIANSGFGLLLDGKKSNGLITADSNDKKIHFLANVVNNDLKIDKPGENLTYYYDDTTKSIVRYDPFATQETSAIINRISEVKFDYFDYVGSNSTAIAKAVPTSDTGRVRITVTVSLENVQGQPDNQKVTFSSDVTLRNAKYMLNQY